MTVYTKDQANRNLDSVLAEATASGEVRIRRDDGAEFALRLVSVPPTPPTPPAPEAQTLCAQSQRDLSDIAGTWVEDPGFDEVIAAQRQIDPEAGAMLTPPASNLSSPTDANPRGGHA